MEQLATVVSAGVLLGLVLAAFFSKRWGARLRGTVDTPGFRLASTDAINMAHIRVAGIGGLGLVAMAAAVAISIPSIRQALAFAATLGLAFGAFLILRRRREGPLSSGGDHMGANAILSIDESPRSSNTTRERRSPTDTMRGVAVVPTR